MAFFMCVVYFMLIYLRKIEIIRQYTDYSFDLVNVLLYQYPVKTSSSKILIAMYDNNFLKHNKLVNQYNEPNYGYLFPRKYIISFINTLDKIEKKDNIYPKALFIDFDLSFPSLPDKTLSLDDKKLIEVLSHDRNYIIFIPKNNAFNFIEKSKNSEIQKLIKKRKIRFVSVDFLLNNDSTAKRYILFSKIGNKLYENIITSLYKIDTNQTFKITNNKSYFTNILFKGYKNSYQSYWENIYKISVEKFFSRFRKDINNSFIFLGTSYSFNNDKYNIFPFSTIQFNGIEILANAYETLYYFNQIKLFNIVNCSLAFILFVLMILLYKRVTKDCWENILKYIVLFILFFISIFVLMFFRNWIDYLLIIISFGIGYILYYLCYYFFKICMRPMVLKKNVLKKIKYRKNTLYKMFHKIKNYCFNT